jgi:hypothetical protein
MCSGIYGCRVKGLGVVSFLGEVSGENYQIIRIVSLSVCLKQHPH